MADVSEVEVDNTTRNPDVVTKYQTAAEIANKALTAVRAACVKGAKVLDICKLGDKIIEDGAAGVYRKAGKDGVKIEKGIAFPTCISVNNTVCHFSPLESDAPVELADNDVVKIELGTHIDGFPAVVGETVIIGATKDAPATGRAADVALAAHLAGEAAYRLIKVGGNSSEVVKTVNAIVSSFDCKSVEGFASHQMERNVLDGEKTMVFNPSEHQRNTREVEFEEHEVYSVDILISTGEGKGRQLEARTTVYRKTDATYQLKLKASRAVFSEVQAKAGSMAFSLRALEDEKKARLGIVECAKHGLVTPFDVFYEKEGTLLAVVKFTVLLLPAGQLRITSSAFDPATVKSEHSVTDEAIAQLLATPVVRKAKKKKAAKKEDGAAEAAE